MYSSMEMEKSRSVPQYGKLDYYWQIDDDDSHQQNQWRNSQPQSKSYNFNGNYYNNRGFSAPGDPDGKRKKRVASYNMYTVEGKLKSSVKNSIKWIKNKLSADHVSYDA